MSISTLTFSKFLEGLIGLQGSVVNVKSVSYTVGAEDFVLTAVPDGGRTKVTLEQVTEAPDLRPGPTTPSVDDIYGSAIRVGDRVVVHRRATFGGAEHYPSRAAGRIATVVYLPDGEGDFYVRWDGDASWAGRNFVTRLLEDGTRVRVAEDATYLFDAGNPSLDVCRSGVAGKVGHVVGVPDEEGDYEIVPEDESLSDAASRMYLTAIPEHPRRDEEVEPEIALSTAKDSGGVLLTGPWTDIGSLPCDCEDCTGRAAATTGEAPYLIGTRVHVADDATGSMGDTDFPSYVAGKTGTVATQIDSDGDYLISPDDPGKPSDYAKHADLTVLSGSVLPVGTRVRVDEGARWSRTGQYPGSGWVSTASGGLYFVAALPDDEGDVAFRDAEDANRGLAHRKYLTVA